MIETMCMTVETMHDIQTMHDVQTMHAGRDNVCW